MFDPVFDRDTHRAGDSVDPGVAGLSDLPAPEFADIVSADPPPGSSLDRCPSPFGAVLSAVAKPESFECCRPIDVHDRALNPSITELGKIAPKYRIHLLFTEMYLIMKGNELPPRLVSVGVADRMRPSFLGFASYHAAVSRLLSADGNPGPYYVQ